MNQEDYGPVKESVSFSLTKLTFKKACKGTKIILRKGFISTLLLLLLLTFLAFSFEDTLGIALAVFTFVFALLILIINAKANKLNKKRIDTFVKKHYTYELYEKHIRVILRDEKGEDKEYVIPLKKRKIFLEKGFLFFFDKNIAFPLPISELKENSKFLTLKKNSPFKRNTHAKKRTILEKWALVFFIASIASLWGAMFVMATLSAQNHRFTDNMWVFFLFLPITISSIILGIACNVKGIKNKKNIIAGLIVSILLCIYGSFSFVFKDLYDDSYGYVTNAETLTGVSFPEEGDAVTMLQEMEYEAIQTFLYYTTEVYYTDEQCADFEVSLSNGVWETQKSSLYSAIIPSIASNLYTTDYFFVYNVTENSFNTLPSISGTYCFLYAGYSSEENHLVITKYDLTYVA